MIGAGRCQLKIVRWVAQYSESRGGSSGVYGCGGAVWLTHDRRLYGAIR